MKCIILLALCGIAAANVLPLGIPAAVHAPVISTGASTQTRSQDGLGNYAFAYKESHGTGGTSRSESGNAHGQVVGSYSLGVVDGRQRTVNYVADALGFRAAITSNEPGVAPKPAAATSIATPGLAVAAAPVLAAPAIAAPIHAPLAAPLAAPYLAAPVVAKTYAAPLVHGPIASYASVVNHAAIAAPVIAKTYAAPILAKTYGAPIAAPLAYY